MANEKLKDKINGLLRAEGFDQVSFEPLKKKISHPFILSVTFPNTYHSCHFYEYGEDILVQFTGDPKNWEGIKVYNNEIEKFIKEFLTPSKGLEHLADAAMKTWSRKKTEDLLILSAPGAKRFKYFIGWFDPETYSDLHRNFVCSGFLTQYTFNEAGVEKGVWGAAQYRTLYTTSILNYEGVDTQNGGFLYYVSGSYVPSVFNVERIVRKKPKRNLNLPPDLPADIVGAFENMPIKKFYDGDALYKKVLEQEKTGLYIEALYYITTPETFKIHFTKILDLNLPEQNDNIAYKAAMFNDKELTRKAFEKGINDKLKGYLIDKGFL